jgi:hypothetical protein
MPNRRMYAQEDAIDEQAGMSDEEMLEQVRMGMGNEGGPPPGSGMRWENLEEDQAALVENPDPANVQAFVQYWGEENLPEGLMNQAGSDMPMPGAY